MSVDVLTETMIAVPVAQAWSFAVDPTTAPQWYANIDRVELLADEPLGLGSRMRFHARFLGRALAYTYEVVEYEALQVFTMTTQQGPFPMTTTYRFTAPDTSSTVMRLRNHGTPTGFGALAAPAVAAAMRRANRADLARIRRILEAGPATPRVAD